jgi:hypothetical protein
MKLQVPGSKFQISSKFQIPTLLLFGAFSVGAYLELGTWGLELS